MTNEFSEHSDTVASQCSVQQFELSNHTSWRTSQREILIAARLAVSASTRKQVADEVAGVLDEYIDADSNSIVSLYWPIRGELDMRDWMHTAYVLGIRIALPVVVTKSKPLVFREWTPDCKMERGIWNIPVPSGSDVVIPSIVVSPLVGYDPDCFRLGYGGGYFDRTLAVMSPRPLIIGIGHPCSAMPTIHPQPHDIPMDVIITGKNLMNERPK